MDALCMRASELYKELIKEIGRLLKAKGFSRKGNCFYLQQGYNWGLLKPSIGACQWRERVGFLLPQRQDKWWIVRDIEPTGSLMDELKGCLVGVAIPAIEQHLSDEQLCDEWSSGRSPGLTDLQRLVNLSVLLKVSGAGSALRDVLNELEVKAAGKPMASMVKQHLRNLEQVELGNGT